MLVVFILLFLGNPFPITVRVDLVEWGVRWFVLAFRFLGSYG